VVKTMSATPKIMNCELRMSNHSSSKFQQNFHSTGLVEFVTNAFL